MPTTTTTTTPNASDLRMLPALTQAVRDTAALVESLPIPAEPIATWDQFKSEFDKLDTPAVELLRERLHALHPNAGWAEELSDPVPESGAWWVVDAVDGAVQLLQGIPLWSVSATLVRDGQAVLTALHHAPFGQTYTAARGHGAWLDDTPATPGTKTDLALAIVATSHPPFPNKQPQAITATANAVGAVLPHLGALRNLGPTSWQIAEVGSGRIDAFWQFGRDEGNLLGGALVAAESGALVTDLQGRPWHPHSESILAAPPALHPRLSDLLRDSTTTSQSRQ